MSKTSELTDEQRRGAVEALRWAAHVAAFGDEIPRYARTADGEDYSVSSHIEAWLDELASDVESGKPMVKLYG